jgi:hypothetical protein
VEPPPADGEGQGECPPTASLAAQELRMAAMASARLAATQQTLSSATASKPTAPAEFSMTQVSDASGAESGGRHVEPPPADGEGEGTRLSGTLAATHGCVPAARAAAQHAAVASSGGSIPTAAVLATPRPLQSFL